MRCLLAIALTATLLETGCADMSSASPPPQGERRPLNNASVNPQFRIRILQALVDVARRDGSLDEAGARQANEELDEVRRWVARQEWKDEGRLTAEQRQEANDRLDQVGRHIDWLRHARP